MRILDSTRTPPHLWLMMAAYFRVSPLVAVYTIIIYFAVTEAQTCILGLPSNASLCTSGTSCGTRETGLGVRTRIIPEISFTCSGTVTGWRAAGEFQTGGNAQTNSVLSIWRETSSGSGTYNRSGGIQLGICGSEDPVPSVVGMSHVYECSLPQSERMSVQSGDVVGIELPAGNRADFRLYFNNTNNGPTNYVFNGHGTTFSLSQAISSEQASDQPQVSLTVVLDNIATTLSIIQPPSMTEASSTMADLPTTPPLTSTLMATTDLEAPTSTKALMTAPAAMDPSATTTTEASTTTMSAETQPSATTGSPTPDTAVMTNVNSESTTVGSTATEIPASTTDAQTSIPPTGRGGEAAQPESDTGTVAGAAVGAIIAVFLVLIIVHLLILVLRRQNQPSSNANIVNAAYINDSVAVQDPRANASGMVGAHNIMHLSATHDQQITTEDNMAYNQVTPQFPIVDNVAYYDTSKIQTEDNVAYSQAAASQLQFTMGDNDCKEDDCATISDLNEYDYV